jgi:hypothetical protein
MGTPQHHGIHTNADIPSYYGGGAPGGNFHPYHQQQQQVQHNINGSNTIDYTTMN